MGLMEPGCKLEDFGRLAQPAATNRLRCRVNVVSERYLVETHIVSKRCSRRMFGLCMENRLLFFDFLSWIRLFSIFSRYVGLGLFFYLQYFSVNTTLFQMVCFFWHFKQLLYWIASAF
jgi:hypothetical protein